LFEATFGWFFHGFLINFELNQPLYCNYLRCQPPVLHQKMGFSNILLHCRK